MIKKRMSMNKWKWRVFTAPTMFEVMNEEVSKTLDGLLNKYLDIGIKSASESKWWIYVEFNNGVKAKLWNENRWHSWLDEGSIGEYNWGYKRPRKSTMRRFKHELDNYWIARM